MICNPVKKSFFWKHFVQISQFLDQKSMIRPLEAKHFIAFLDVSRDLPG